MSGSLRFGRLAVATLIFFGAASVAVWQYFDGRTDRRAIARLDGELAAARRERDALEEAMTVRRQKLAEERNQGAAEAAKFAKALQETGAASALATWANPPAQLPLWDPSSPYVWLRKEQLSQFPFHVFDADGQLNPEISAMLAISPEAKRRLDSELARLLVESRRSEAARAERSEEHLAGIANEDGEKLTVRVPPSSSEGTEGRSAFEALLRADLGEGRAELLEKLAADWIDSNFSGFGNEARVISILRRPDGTYSIATQSGRSWLSTSGMRSIDNYVPAHLRAFFEPFTGLATKPVPGTP